jgi:hypothetical protein
MLDKHAVKERALAEAKRFSVVVGYLWVLFSTFELYKWIVLRQHNLTSALGFKVGINLINAVVLGKVIFIAEALRAGERLRNRPLIQPILYKSALFSVILICFHIVEEVLVGIFHGKTISQGIPKMGGGGLVGILIVGVITFVVLIPFFTLREIGRVVGQDELKSMILGRGTKAGTVQPRAQQDNDRVA